MYVDTYTMDSPYSAHHLQQPFVHSVKRFTISSVDFGFFKNDGNCSLDRNVHYIESQLYNHKINVI